MACWCVDRSRSLAQMNSSEACTRVGEVPGADQQLSLHPARPAGPAPADRPGGAVRGDLYLGAGDRRDTNIIVGTESGLETILVLTGVTRREDVARYPYRPTHIVESVADIAVSY